MAAMITPHNPSSGHYPAQYYAQAPAQYQLPQGRRQAERQSPVYQGQIVIQQSQPPYQQQPVVQQQQQQQQRIIHVNPRQAFQEEEEEPAAPIRRFVNFKNLKHLNQPGQQWEHCDRVTISLSSEELDRKIQCHNIPGNDLIHCLTRMGMYRQRHVQRYVDKLNSKETDPANWSWTLEALGEVREKRKSTPHTFWAIFQRTSRKDRSQHTRQVRQVTVHNEPVRIVEGTHIQQIQAPPQPPTLPAPLQRLALPAPPPAANSPPNYYQQTPQSVPAYPPRPRQAAYLQQSPQQQSQQSQQSQRPQRPTQAPQPQIHQQQPPARQSPPLGPTALEAPAPQQPVVAAPAAVAPKQYTRPIPGPISLTTRRRATSPLRNYTRISDIDVTQFQQRSPVRTPRRWLDDQDSLSYDSTSSDDSSSGSSTEYYASSARRPAPLTGENRITRHGLTTSSGRRRSNSNGKEERIRHHVHPDVSAAPRIMGERACAAPGGGEGRKYLSHSQSVRQNTIEVKIGPTRAYTTKTMPRSHTRRPADGYESSEGAMDERGRGTAACYGKVQRSKSTRRHNGVPEGYYAAQGLVTYGGRR